MSSSDQGHSTDNDNQMPTSGPDATGSSATAVDTIPSRYLDFTLSNGFEYTSPADVYKRFRDNQSEKDQFQLGPWKLIYHHFSSRVPRATIERHFTDYDGQGSPNTMLQTVKTSSHSGNNAAQTTTNTQQLKLYGWKIMYCTRSEVLHATIERLFTRFDDEGIPSSLSQTVKDGSEIPVSSYTWGAGANNVLGELEHADPEVHMKLQRPWSKPRVKVMYRRNPGQPDERSETPPALVTELATRMEERMIDRMAQNVVENSWANLRRKLAELPQRSTNADDLFKTAQPLWDEISQAYLNDCIGSMPSRLREITASGGHPTSY